ncbi:MAG: trehalose-phosphatase [Acidimicrobiales bacterium]
MKTNGEVSDALRALARTPVLLVACDYDGTLAPIVDNPDEAFPHRESIAALRALAAFPDTHVAVVSGRSLRDLAALSRLPAEIHLVGSHGSEFDAGFLKELDPTQLELRQVITQELETIAAGAPGCHVEKKPASVALHYRLADPAVADSVIEAILSGPGSRAGVQVKNGKKVVELAVIETNKGVALETLRRQVGAEAVLFVGDDVTDEDAFERLRGPDVGIKIGPGITAAELRLDDTEDASRALALLCERRRAWLQGDNSPAIERHTLLSDQRTVALSTPDGRVTWMCHPRADSPAVFAELVGGPGAGYFCVHPADHSSRISHRYLSETMVVETRWSNLVVTDFLDCAEGRPAEPAGRTDLVRILEGSGPVHIEFAPRLDYGRAPTQLETNPAGLVVRGAQDLITLRAPGVNWSIDSDGLHDLGHGEVHLTEGEPVVLELRFDTDPDERPLLDHWQRHSGTIDYWRTWVEKLEVPTLGADEVRRSALTLKALVHQPSGAILAAATTSLPEVAGGVRNWDYRYCWPRDASMTAAALVELGSVQEAIDLVEWLLDRVHHLHGPEQLRPVYALEGDEFLPEAVLPTLHGYLGSRPVRIGNAAEHQVQLDVFGPVVDLVYRLALHHVAITPHMWELVSDMVIAVAARWHEPDNGIWEERRPQRHHVHSKVMCWMAVDRAMKIAELSGHSTPPDWPELRQTIADDVITNGWNESVGAYTIAYGDEELDAAVLLIGLCGLLPPDDDRYVKTVRAIERELRNGPIVYRYRLDDGLPGEEGGFLICTAWLIEAYVAVGRYDEARTLFDRYLGLAGATGLLSEQYDPDNERMLGNHPQAYSHIGLINAALALDGGR